MKIVDEDKWEPVKFKEFAKFMCHPLVLLSLVISIALWSWFILWLCGVAPNILKFFNWGS